MTEWKNEDPNHPTDRPTTDEQVQLYQMLYRSKLDGLKNHWLLYQRYFTPVKFYMDNGEDEQQPSHIYIVSAHGDIEDTLLIMMRNPFLDGR
jgi:hypothetical protein